MTGQYPERIKTLPLFDGRFDAYKLAADALAADKCDVLFASYPAGTEIPSHKHDTDNHGVITRGELILTMNGEVKCVRIGEWYHVPANVEHSAKFNVETDEIEFWFHENTCRPCTTEVNEGQHLAAKSCKKINNNEPLGIT